jgi:hypothetical protein
MAQTLSSGVSSHSSGAAAGDRPRDDLGKRGRTFEAWRIGGQLEGPPGLGER